MKNEIIAMLEDMNDVQMKNVLDYVTDEYDEEDHESHMLTVLKQQIETSMVLKIKAALKDRPEYSEENSKWVMDELNKLAK